MGHDPRKAGTGGTHVPRYFESTGVQVVMLIQWESIPLDIPLRLEQDPPTSRSL